MLNKIIMRFIDKQDKIQNWLIKIIHDNNQFTLNYGNHIISSKYKQEMEEAFRLARIVKWAETQKEMNTQFLRFKIHCDNCK